MKRLLVLFCIVALLPFIMAPRGGNQSAVKNLMPRCAATSGACPSDKYFCEDSSQVLWICRITGTPTGWSTMTVADEAITEAKLDAKDAAADEECLTYESSTSDFEWQVCGGGGGSAVALDLGNDGDDSTGLSKIVTVGDTNSIFTEPVDNQLQIDLTKDWPGSDTADALAADPANCSAGQVAGGVTADGDAESCLDPITEIELDTESELEARMTDMGNVIQATEIDTVSKLNALITGADGLLDTDSGGTIADALLIDGDGDEVQLTIQSHSTQNAAVLVTEDNGGIDKFVVDTDGNITLGDDTTADITVTFDTGEGGSNPVLIWDESDDTFDVNKGLDLGGDFIVGDGGGTDQTITFDGGNTDGTIHYDHDNDRFETSKSLTVGGTGSTITAATGNDLSLTVDDGQLITTAKGFSLTACANTAAAATVAVDNCNIVTFTGTAASIDTINTCNAANKGRILYVLCGADASAVGDGSGNVQLSAAFTCGADDTLTLVCEGSTGDWLELSRSAN